MPAQQCLWRDEEAAPAAAPKQPARGGEKDAIPALRLGSRDLTAQNVKLMAQHNDLKLLGLIRARAQQDQFQHAPQSTVKDRPEHEQTPGSLTKTGHAICPEARPRLRTPQGLQRPIAVAHARHAAERTLSAGRSDGIGRTRSWRGSGVGKAAKTLVSMRVYEQDRD